MDVNMYYGPRDPSLLNLQTNHRSSALLTDETKLDMPLHVRHTEHHIWGPPNRRNIIHGRVIQKLEMMGFYGVYSCHAQKVDNHLVTALVERWRKETHTFHLRFGEATVTLQDVGILWRLPIEGRAVTGVDCDRDFTQWRDYCQQFLGFLPGENDLKGSKILLRPLGQWLIDNAITEESSEMEVEQHARAYALLLMGCVMFPDSSGNSTSLLYVQNLENINEVRYYSWGSAVLAYLYHELCTSTEKDKTNIGGALRLLQVWAWTRILPWQPVRQQELVEMSEKTYDGINLPIPAHAARWTARMSYTSIGRCSVRLMREMLDNMNEQQFVWQPYDMNLPEISSLSEEYQPMSCRSTCPLIFYNIVEMHNPERVLRQFNLLQDIPPEPMYRDSKLHDFDRRGRKGVNWRVKHQNWINEWDRRIETIRDGKPIVGLKSVDGGYYEWYNTITRRFISPSAMAMNKGFQQPGDGVAWESVGNGLNDILQKIDHLESVIPMVGEVHSSEFNGILRQGFADVREIVGRLSSMSMDMWTFIVPIQENAEHEDEEHHQQPKAKKCKSRRRKRNSNESNGGGTEINADVD